MKRHKEAAYRARAREYHRHRFAAHVLCLSPHREVPSRAEPAQGTPAFELALYISPYPSAPTSTSASSTRVVRSDGAGRDFREPSALVQSFSISDRCARIISISADHREPRGGWPIRLRRQTRPHYPRASGAACGPPKEYAPGVTRLC